LSIEIGHFTKENLALMRVGIVNQETWAFFDEIYADLSDHHQTSLFESRTINPPFFKERLNRRLFTHDLKAFLGANQVVFFEWASEMLQAATQLPKTCGIVTRLHRYEMYQFVEHINWDPVDRIILVSDAKKSEFNALFPQYTTKIVVIPEAISLNRFQSQPKEFNGDIGILCHLTPRKRVYELVLAFYELTRLRDGLHLHIGGGKHVLFGDYYAALQDLVKKLNLQDRVTFYGPVSNAQEWHHKIDVFVSNSYSEGLQVSPMEAIASGCYCLSHRWDGAEELLPEDNLFITEGEFVSKVLSYCELSQDEMLQKIVGLQEIVRERFDIDRIKTQIRGVVEEVGQSQ
jgi:glycosyltransferase involved in cell wall biosynthesis